MKNFNFANKMHSRIRLTIFLFLFGLSAFAQTTVTYTQQQANYYNNFTVGTAGSFNQGAFQLGMYANAGATKQVASFRKFRTDASGSSISDRSMKVGDQFVVTLSATRAFGRIGFSLLASPSATSSWADRENNYAMSMNLDGNGGAWGNWYSKYNGGGTSAGSANVAGQQSTYKNFTFTLTLTAPDRMNATWTDGTTTSNLYDIQLNTSNPITDYCVFLEDDWDGGAPRNIYWGLGAVGTQHALTNTGNCTIGQSNTSFTTSGIIFNGLDGNSASTNSLNNNLAKSGTGVLTLSGANTYAGTTTVNGGSLQLGAAGVIPDASNVTLNGGTLRSGATTGFSETMGTLNLNANSTIALGTGAHTLTFANSSAVSWTGNQLIITGWAGTYNGASSGTGGKIFVGNSSSGLTSLQWTKIQFFNGTNYFPATQLSTGEVVPTGAIALYWGGTAAQSWTSATWGTVNGGPYTTAWTSFPAAIFNVAASSITGASTAFTSITANENVTVTATGTISTGGTVAPIYVASGKTFTFAGQGISTAAGTGLIKNGPGIYQSSNGNAFLGGFTLNDGLISAGGVNAMGAGGALTINGGTIGANATRDFTGKFTSITIGGNFTLGSSSSPAVGTSNLTFSNATALGSSTTRTITIGGTGTYAWNGVISGTSSNLIFNSTAAGIFSMGAANTYGGNTTINGGTLRTDIGLALPSTTVITLANTAGAILNLNSFAQTVASLSGGGTTGGNITLGSAILTVNQTANTSYSGLMSGTGGLTKTGSGILTLGHTANTYSGATTITAGELRLNPSTTTATFASQVVLNGGKLSTTSITAATTFTSSSTLSLTANSSIDLGANAHSLKFAASDLITWTGATTLTINGWTGSGGTTGTAGKIFFGAANTALTSTQLSQITFTGFPGTPILLSTGELVPAAVGTTTLSASALTAFGSVCINTTTVENSFTITGTALTTANVTVAALTGYTFSTTAGGTYTSSLSLAQVGGAYNQTIYVRFSPTAVISYNGNIAIGGGGATSINVAAAGSGINTAPAVTTTAATTVTSSTASSGGSGITSACGTITAKGVVWGLAASPTVPSVNSTNDGTGTTTFTSSISGLSPGTLYNYRSYVTNSNGVTSYGVNNTFTTINFEPSNFPTSFACGTTTSSTIPLTWTDATGANLPGGYLIKWSSTSYGAITDPIDGTAVANGAGVQNVSQGTGSYTLTGLTSLTTYFIKIWSYSNTGTSIDYKLVGEPQTSCATLIAPVTIYAHNFDVGATASPYTSSPTTLDANLSTPTSWVNSIGTFTNFAGATGQAIATQPGSGVTSSITLSFNVATGYTCDIASFNFWRQRSASGPTTINSIVINGTTVATSITVPTAGASTGNTNVSSPISGLTGTVTVVLNISAPSAAGSNLRLDDFTLSGNVLSIGTLTTSTSVGTSFCAGATGVSVPFTYTPSVNFPSGTCTFTAQLSNAAGSFASPVTLQSVTSNGSGSQSISATIPALTTSGAGYRIRVVSASPGVNGSDNASNISISNTATSIAPSTTQNITTSTNGTTLTVTEGTTATSRVWKYGTVSGVYGTSTGITTSTYTPNFVLPGTYYIVCVTTYPAPCSNVITSNEVQVNVVGSVDYTWNGSASSDWSNSSNWTPNGVPIIDDNVTINVPGTNTLIVTDARSINNLIVSGTGIFQLTSSGALSVYASVTNSIAGSPTFNCASTFSMLSASSQTIPSWNFGNLIASGGARVLSSSGTIGICGTFTPGAGAYTNTGSTVNFNGTGTQTVNAINYNNLSISGAHTTNSITLPAGSIGIAGTFSPTATFSSGTYSNSGNTIDYNGAGAQTVAAFSSYNNLTISGARASAAITLASGTIGVAGTFNPSATTVTYTSTGNTFNYSSAGSQTIAVFSQYNNLSNSGNGARTLANGIIAIYGTYTPTTAAITVGTSTVDFAGAAGQTIPASFYYNITNSSNTNRTWANAGIIDIKNTFTPTSATNTITGSTVQYSATSGTLNLTTFTTNIASRNYNNLIINGTGGSWNLNANTIGVANDLTVSAGTLIIGVAAGAGTINVDGNLTVNGGTVNTTNSNTNAGTLNLFGNLTVSSGTFSKSGSGLGTVNLIKSTGTQTFTGGGTISNANAWNFGNGTTANTIQIATNISASTGVFNVNTGTTVDFGTNTLTVTSGAFNLNSGATLNTTNAAGITTSGATGSILRSSGSNTFSVSANYIFGGAITGTGFTGANNLTINNASGVTLSAAATVNGALTFTNGLLDIAAVNLTIGSTGSITGANTAKYVKTSGAGQLKMTVAASNVLFPVGRSAFNPLTLNNSGTSDVFGVVLADAISQSLNNSALVVNRSWNITETVAGGSNLSIVSQWNGVGEQAAGFAAGTTPRIAYWNGSAWVQTGATQAGANPFTFTSTASLSGIASATYSIAIGKDDAFICTAAPTVSLVLPTSGYSGDVITINGSGLTGLTSATIGGTAATIVSQFGTSATLTVGAGATGVITVSKSPVCSASSASSFTFLGFVSAQTGNWSLGSTWQGGVVPPSGSAVTILNSHNVTLNVNSAPSGVTINSGGTLTLNNATNTLNLGAGTLLVNGTLSVTAAVNAATAIMTAGTLNIGTGGTFTNSAGNAGSISVTTFNVNSGATYNHDALGSSSNGTLSDFPGLTGGANISINSNASVNITKWAQNTGTPTTLPSVSGGQWGNLTINISGLTYSGSWQNSGILTNATSLNVVNTGSKDFRLVTPTGTAGFTCTIGSVNVSGGIFIFIGGGSIGSGVVTMNVTNDFNVSGGVASIHGTPNSSTSYNTTGVTLNVGGNLNITGGSFYGHANAQTNTVAVSSSSTTLNVTGNLSINNGTLDLAFLPNYNIAGNTGNVNLNVKGNLTLGTTGILRNSNSIAPLGKTTATVNFNHASVQQTWTQTGTIQDVIGFNVNGTANTLQLLSNANIGTSTTSSFNVANAATFDMQAFVLGGSGAFTSAAGSTLKIGNADGITTIPTLSGNVQLTASRTFNAATSYTYTGSVNQVTGNGLPSITTGALSIANTGAASNNTVTLTTTGTTVTTFNLTSGLFAAGSAQQLNIASGGTVNATSGDFANGTTAGVLNFPGTGTFTGNTNPYNVYASGGVNFGAGTVTIQPAGTFRINSGGFVNTNAPFYASGSTLQYNTTGVYGRNIEWRASSGRGYPHHVQVSNSTTLNPGANSNTGQPFNAGGNLTIDAGSNIYMDFGGLNMSVPLTVTGGLNLNGNLSLSGSIGGDINVGGDWTNNGTASNFFANSRAVTFNGSVNQNIGGSNTSSNPFAFVTINNAAGGTLTFGQSVSNTLTFSAGNLSLGIYDLTISPGASISGASSSKFIITNSSGKLVQNLVNNSTSKTYPIGANSSAYTPAILSQTASGVTDNIGVRVSSAPAFDNAVNDNTQMIGVQWTINESVAGGNNLVTSFQWPQAIEGASFVRANGVFHGNWTGSNYVVRPTSASSGSDPYTSASTVNYTSTLSNQPFVLGNINGVLGCFSSTASGSWNSNSTWSSGIVPVSGVSVCLNHNITIGSADPNPDAVLGVTLNGSSTLDIHSSKTLTFSNGGALINNSGLVQNIGAGTVLSSGVLAISGANSITMSHLTLNGNTTITTAPSISGNLTLNSGAFLTAAPIYGSASTLIYNTGGLYTVSNEWTGNSTAPGLGIPNNVTVNGSFLTMPNSSRGLSGNLSISAGSLDLNSISGDLYIAGNWNRNIGASFNANNRAVFFNGAANQTITVTGGDAETFAYLVLDKSAGNLIIDNTQPSDVAINGDSGNILQINSGNSFDLNGRNLSLVGTGGNVNLPSGSSSITGSAGSKFIIWNGAKTITPSLGATLNFDSNVTVVLNNGFNFGATTSTINGTLQIANGGFVSTNSPSYAIGSTLRYFTGSNFNRGLEWSTNSGQGYPHHVVVDLNSTVTTVNLAPGAATCQVAGNLTVNNGAILNMGAMVNPLVVLGNVTVGGASSGTLSLSSVAGGDIKIGGNLTRNSGGTLTQNGREVEMNGTLTQNISGVPIFDYLAINNSAASVKINDNTSINTRLRLSNGIFDLNSLGCTLANGSKILRINGTMSASPTLTGSNVYDLEYQNSVTSSFEYLASSTAVRDLIITSGNTLTLGENRTFNRDLTLSGGDLNLGGFTLTARGRATAPSFSGSITVSGGGALTITGPAGSTFDITGLGANLPNDYTKTVSSFGGSTLSFDSNVLVRIGDGAVDFGSGSPTTINGTLQVLLAGSVGQILNPCYYGVNSLLRFSNTVDYQVGSNDKTWASGAIASGNPGIPYNVEVMDANTDLQLQSTRALRGNLTITDGTFTLTPAYSGSFNIGGNWTRSGATSAFNHNSKKVVFDRQTAGSQTITLSSGISTETFYDLEVSLFSGNLVTAASSSLTISNNLNFVSGKIDLGANRLTIGTGLANGTITGANSSKYVITNAVAGGGNIKAFTNSNTAYVFPVGDATNYSPMSVTLTNGAQVGSYISTTAVQGIHPNLLTGAPPTKYISRYWSVVPSGLSIDPVYDVSFSYVVADEVGIGTLYPIKYSTETTTPGWLSCPGSTAAAVTGTSGANDNVLKTFTWAGLTTFSDFSGAGDGSPLPVTWLNFDAQFNNTTNNVDVSWTTASEINNDYFEVMRSVDAVNFEVVGTVDGAGNSSLVKDYAFVDTNPLTGLSYYKIRQVDFNGQSDNTEILAVSNLGGIAIGTLFTYPNPLIGQDLTIVYSNLDKGNWDYRLVDITGKIVLAQNRTSDLNAGAFTLNLEQLPAGIYLFQLNTQSQNFTRKITISK